MPCLFLCGDIGTSPSVGLCISGVVYPCIDKGMDGYCYSLTDLATSLCNRAVFSKCSPNSERFVTPRNTMFASISCLKMVIARRTPSSPYPDAKLYRNGRPSPTAVAPSARALSTSVPRRIPPSMKICMRLRSRNGACRRISSSVRRGGCAVSWDLPPWLERTIPCTPFS